MTHLSYMHACACLGAGAYKKLFTLQRHSSLKSRFDVLRSYIYEHVYIYIYIYIYTYTNIYIIIYLYKYITRINICNICTCVLADAGACFGAGAC